MRAKIAMAASVCTLAVAALGVALATPASADDSIPEDAKAALSRLQETGSLSGADRATLLRYPEIAAHVVDPESGSLAPDDTVRLLAASGCHKADRYIAYKTLLGFKAFDWHSVVNYCWSSGKVSLKERYYYMANNDGTNYDMGLILNSQTGNGTATYYSRMQGKVENKFGDVAWTVKYPRIDYKVYGATGSYEITQTP
ncbi:hypothetical protein [Sphaerimonospora thailandensis]|uniref:Secreted protein n=1 Tax=Sphaerimonospora thailandensis TaxID=795644 RepID=A0A8J3W214_9ACTN|nr:hypothetical protein [Sphaerimonospora thailandensis]GIH73337.1 hypothetical protein Mth01_55900 [Sphaerimonospora thailandensis]